MPRYLGRRSVRLHPSSHSDARAPDAGSHCTIALTRRAARRRCRECFSPLKARGGLLGAAGKAVAIELKAELAESSNIFLDSQLFFDYKCLQFIRFCILPRRNILVLHRVLAGATINAPRRLLFARHAEVFADKALSM